MATPNISDEEIQFRKRARRRLVGAIVLVLIVVVVVPWILPADKPQQDAQQIDIRIPAQDASGYAPKVLPAPAATAPADEGAATPAPAAAPAADAPKPDAKPGERSVASFADPAAAFSNAMSRAGENDRIVVFGSFYTVAGVMAARKTSHH